MSHHTQPYFNLKAEFIPFTVLKLTQKNIDGITQQLKKTIHQAPNYFVDAPLIIDVAAITPFKDFSLAQLCQLLRDFKIIPVAIRGLAESDHTLAKQHGLTILKQYRDKTTAKTTSTKKSLPPLGSNTKIITKPIRAGTQVYAHQGDLIVLAGVNPGGECIADGSIHVYGPLRGRALAGAQGDSTARIFCRSLHAELVAIAGHYMIKDNIPPTTDHGIIQIYLNNQQLHFDAI